MFVCGGIKTCKLVYIAAHPGSPRIHEDMIQAKENDTFSLHCHADVGIPPVELRFVS